MPVQPTAERLKRIMVLVPWVMQRGSPTVEEVCEHFGMTPRELAADIDLLMVCGLWPFSPGDYIEAFIEGGCVTIGMAHALDRPPRLTRAEAMAVLVAGRAVAALPGLEVVPSLRSALGKLATAVAPQASGQTEELAARVVMSLDEDGSDVLGLLSEAVRGRVRLRLTYHSAGRDELTERLVDPLLVFGAAGAWYLVAQDGRSEEERLFRVDRIKDVTQTDDTFEPPAGFDPARFRRDPLYSPSDRDIEAVLDLAPAATWLVEAVAVERVDPRPDGGVRLTLRTPQIPWLVRLLLSAGPDAVVVAPDELSAAVRDAARAALDGYASA